MINYPVVYSGAAFDENNNFSKTEFFSFSNFSAFEKRILHRDWCHPRALPLTPRKNTKNVGGKLKQKKRYGGGEGGVEQQKH